MYKLKQKRIFLMQVCVLFCFCFSNISIADAKLFRLFKKDKKSIDAELSKSSEIKAYANYCVAVSAMMDKKWDAAIKYLKKTLAFDPNSEKVHLYLASSYFQIKDKDSAIVHIKEASRIKPNDFNIHYTLGNILRVEGNTVEAIAELELAIGCEIVETNKVLYGDALLNLANLYVANDDLEKAISCLQAVINIDISSDVAKLHFEIGRLYFKNGDFDNAREAFKIVEAIDPHVINIYPYLSICYEQSGSLQHAVNEANIYLSKVPNAWNMYVSLQRMYTKMGEVKLAKESYEKAGDILKTSIRLGSKDVEEYTALGQILLNQDKAESALSFLKRGLLLTNDETKKRDIHFFMSTIYYELEDFDNVESELIKTLEIDKDYHQANNFLGFFYAEQGRNIDAAITLILKALEVEPNNGAYLDSLGWAYYKKAIVDDKDDLIELALEKLIAAAAFADDPEIKEHTGDVYFSLGNWENAELEWKKALDFVAEKESKHFKKVSARVKGKIEKLNNLKFFDELDSKEVSTTNNIKKINVPN